MANGEGDTIMHSGDLEPFAFFTTNGKDIWKLGTFCLNPTCELTNLETGDVESFGMGGVTAGRFHKIPMPMAIKKEAEEMTKEPTP